MFDVGMGVFNVGDFTFTVRDGLMFDVGSGMSLIRLMWLIACRCSA